MLSALCAAVLLFSFHPAQGASIRGGDLYRSFAGTQDGYHIWIVDGAAVRREVYPEFLYGGNGERYRFVPPDEIWIDHAISVEEYGYTLAHERCERRLMATRGLTYADAHDSALALERVMRLADAAAANEHEHQLPRVAPRDCDDVKEIAALPDSIGLAHIYRVDHGIRDGVHIWIVDGAIVRRDIFPDFGLSGNDRAYRFIPAGEIWLDNAMSCEEMEPSIAAELDERRLMAAGRAYDDAYEHSLTVSGALRRAARRASVNHRMLRASPPLDRDVGTGTESK